MTVGQRIRRERKRLAITGRELARRAGLAQSLISSIERGQTLDPRVSTVIALSRVLGLTVQDLIVGRPA
jgi:transcriptional regulator with XRE-family HTH domain